MRVNSVRARYASIVATAFELARPGEFLRLRLGPGDAIDLSAVDVAQIWSLVALAALARENGEALGVKLDGVCGRAAIAVGFREAVRGEDPGTGADGTAKMRRVRTPAEIEGVAREVSRLLLSKEDDDEPRRTVHFVLVELMRNAVQHSGDPKGGVIAAQRIDARSAGYSSDVVQVAVADTGIGVLASLSAMHTELDTQVAALTKALEPHVSGTFEPGRRGGAENAGMGLFMIAEMAKAVGGRLLVASRGGAILLTGHLDDLGNASHRLEVVAPPGVGFAGTLVAFELPIDGVARHDGLIELILEKREQRSASIPATPWLRFTEPPSGATEFAVGPLVEDTTRATQLSREQLQPRLFRREAITIDFSGVDLCTQSFVHALLFEAIRLSWATQTPIYIRNASPGVRVILRYVEAYARSG